jgi:hypothetical protein
MFARHIQHDLPSCLDLVCKGLEALPCTSHCFRVKFPINNSGVSAISISISPDTNRGIYKRLVNNEPLKIQFEIALVSDCGEIICRPDFLRRFDYNCSSTGFGSMLELVREIQRLANVVQDYELATFEH